MRCSIVAVSSSVTGVSNAMSRAANHICLWPPSSSQPASSRACASKSPRSRCCNAVPSIDSVEVTLEIAGMRVADHRAEAFDGADTRQRRDRRFAHALAQQVLRLRDVRERLGPQRRAARRGSRCRTARGATAATRRSPAPGTSCAARRTCRRRCSRRDNARRSRRAARSTASVASSSCSLQCQLEVGHGRSVNARVTPWQPNRSRCCDPSETRPDAPRSSGPHPECSRESGLRRDLDGGRRRRGGHHEADRVPALRLEGGPVPLGARTRVRAAGDVVRGEHGGRARGRRRDACAAHRLGASIPTDSGCCGDTRRANPSSRATRTSSATSAVSAARAVVEPCRPARVPRVGRADVVRPRRRRGPQLARPRRPGA